MQTIWKKRGDDYCILKSEGKRGRYVCKLKIYNVTDVKQLDKSQWWKKAQLRTRFLSSSDVDPVMMTVKKLEAQIVRQMENVKKRKVDRLVEWLRQFPTSPLLSITHLNYWMNSSYKYLQKNCNLFINVFDVFQHSFIEKTIEWCQMKMGSRKFNSEQKS